MKELVTITLATGAILNIMSIIATDKSISQSIKKKLTAKLKRMGFQR
jgi:hypothetical protein